MRSSRPHRRHPPGHRYQPRDARGRYASSRYRRGPQPPVWATALVFAAMVGLLVLIVVAGD